MLNNKIKRDYQNTLKTAFLKCEDNENLIKFISIIYKSCNYQNPTNDLNSLIFMEGRRSLYQNLFVPFMSKKLRAKAECEVFDL